MPRDVLDVANEAALRAGAELTDRYGRPPRGLGAKQGPTDLVSDADRAAEAAIAAVLARRRPDDGILGEEGTANRERDDRPALGRRPARRHRQLPVRDPAVVREHRVRGRRRARSPGVVYDPLREQLVRRRPRRPGARRRRRARASASTTTSPPRSIAGGVACATEEEAKRAAKLEKRLFRRAGAAPRARHRRARARLDGRRADRRRLPRAAHPPVGRRRRPVHLPARRAARAPARAARADELAPRYLAAPAGLAAEVLELVGPSAKERRRRAAERPPLSAERVAEAMRRRERG